jgi:hypothetical protein
MKWPNWLCRIFPFLCRPKPKPAPPPPITSVSLVFTPSAGEAPLATSWSIGIAGGTGPFTTVVHFADGSPDAGGMTGTHTFAAEGSYLPEVDVTDSKGQTAFGYSDGIVVTAPPPPPPPPVPERHVVLGGPPDSPVPLAGRQFIAWDSDILNPADRDFLRPDTVFLDLMFSNRDGTNRRAEIASGSADAEIDALAKKLDVGRKLAITLDHEFTPAKIGDYSIALSAHRRVIQRWKDSGMIHILAECQLAQVFENNRQDDQLAIDAIDAVGVDGYGFSTTGKLNASSLFDPALAYAIAHDKPLIIFEVGFHDAVEGDGLQGTFFDSVDAYLKANPEILGAAFYFGDTQNHQNHLNSDGLAVVTRMAGDPFYSRTFA